MSGRPGMMATAEQTFFLPDLGEGLTEAEIVEWLVAEGDVVVIDQPLVTVLTAKATVEVPSPFAGTVTRCHAAPGDEIVVGAPLVTITETAAGSGPVLVGYGTGDTRGRRRRRRGRAPESELESAPPEPVIEAAGHVVTTPPLRKLARERGVDLGAMVGSGPGGRITRADVEAAAAQPAGSRRDIRHIWRDSRREPEGAIEAAADAGPGGDDVERIPLTGTRRMIAERLARSRREIPDASTWVDADATALVAARAAIAARDPATPIGLLALVARAVVAGLARFPALNAHVDTDAGVILRHRRVHLGIATSSPAGLLVPVVRDAQARTTTELAAEIRRLTEAARAGRLAPAELTGGTFTLNNYGTFGVDGSTPIINHPEAALLGLGRLVEKPWVVDHQLAVRTVTQLSLTFDHRVCDGTEAGGFLRFVADCVETPALLI